MRNVHIAAFRRLFQTDSVTIIHTLSDITQMIDWQTKRSDRNLADLYRKYSCARQQQDNANAASIHLVEI